jgi:hypothetical protein
LVLAIGQAMDTSRKMVREAGQQVVYGAILRAITVRARIR